MLELVCSNVTYGRHNVESEEPCVTPKEPQDTPTNSTSPSEISRQATALSHLLGEIGLSGSEQTTWWNLVAQPDLGNRTATQAWLDGDTDAVKALVERWYEATKSAAHRASSSTEYLEILRKKLAELNKGPLGNNSIRQSA